MKKIKKISLLMSLALLLNVNVIFAQEEPKAPIISDWSVLSVDNAQKKGIVPLTTTYKDYTQNITADELKELNANLEKKFNSYGILKNTSFKDLSTKNELTRETILLNLFNTLGHYDKDVNEKTDAIKCLQENKILLGNGSNLNLDKSATYEETATFYNRAADYLIYKNDFGAKGYFYKAENKNNTVYMFGSIHLGSNEMYPMKKEVMDAFYKSDELYVEVDISNADEMSYMTDLMPRTDGTSLKDDLDAQTYAKLKKYMDKYEIPEENYNSLKLWAAYNQISNIPVAVNKPYGSTLGIDTHFITHAKILGKPVGEMESVKLQADTLAGYDEKSYKNMLVNLIEDLDANGEANQINGIDEMQKAWIDGDKKFMSGMSNTSDPFSQLLLVDRDPKMAEKIEGMLNSDSGKTYFVVVGSLHYVPENSVLKYLTDKGFKVEDLNI
ncbi:hypothetical protein SAMN02745245_00755 [Anaerosphaera aminiphila DSM 21120]|uniref:TraB family protein n=1 Tax=Anaerosphaera aminiphila DSM 21120 TaxID=1120995 RepID=A0A1M5QVK7_9FIRM|nr:TraB/GumN family protein [Anaerosphaera aminiphila]SHH17998.1 hypothetical protein SAMN02745245_00755 [Anaerosphaera aminiphila DSM 21120]